MAAAPEHSEPRRWYTEVRTWVLGAGAIAAAVLSVIALYSRIFPASDDDVDRVTISAEVLYQQPLADFVAAHPELTANLPDALSAGVGGPSIALVRSVVRGADSSDAPVSETSSGAPTSEPTAASTSPSASPSTTASASPTASPSPSPTPSGTGGSTLSPSPSPSSSPTVVTHGSWGIAQVKGLSLEQMRQVARSPVLEDSGVGPTEVFILVPTDEGDEEGGEQDPDVIAADVAASLADIETDQLTEEATPSYLGFVVGVNLEADGLKGVPVVLRWSLNGTGVPSGWDAADRIAYRLTAEEATSTGAFEVWVPVLKDVGAYRVLLEVTRESDDETIAFATTDLPVG